MDTTFALLPITLVLWLDDGRNLAHHNPRVAHQLMQMSLSRCHADLLMSWTPQNLEQARYRNALLRSWYRLPISKFPWIDGLEPEWSFSIGGYTKTRNDIVYQYLADARWICYSYALQVGAPDWIEYRIATELFVDDLLASGYGKQFCLDLIKYLRRKDLEWVNNNLWHVAESQPGDEP